MRRRNGHGFGMTGGPLAGLSGFTDVEPVAAGGTSHVFRARQPAMDRLVAIKVMGVAAVDTRARARFERELAITGRVSAHPLLVTIHGHGVTDAGYPYLVMPWYDGGSLADALQRGGPMSVPAALRIGVRTAAALTHVHGQGLVHRDVKPANVLLSTLGESVLADFGGSARERDAQTATTVVSPLHAAPELLREGTSTVRSDLWSLASTLCTALAGVPPFVVVGPGGQLVRDMSRLQEPPPPLTRPDVPAELRAFLAAGLATSPEQRPTAAELTDRLRRIEGALGLPVTDVPGAQAAGVMRTAPASRSAAAPTRPTPAIPMTAVPVPGDPTQLRPPPATTPDRTWRATAGLAATGALAGAAMAVAVLGLGRALIAPDTPEAGPGTRPTVERAVVQPDSDAVRTTISNGEGATSR